MVHMKYYRPTLSDFEIGEIGEIGETTKGSRYLVTGYPGTGKTTLGKLILQFRGANDICEITSLHLFQGSHLETIVHKHRRTLNVLGLLQGYPQHKGLLFDDICVFHARDKKTFDLICQTYEDLEDSRIMVLTCNRVFLKNRRLQKWLPTIHLYHTHLSTHSLTSRIHDILRLNGIRVTQGRTKSLLQIRNFHRIYEAIQEFLLQTGTRKTLRDDVRDTVSPTDEIIQSLLQETHESLPLQEMMRLVGPDAGIIGLTLTDAIPTYMDGGYSCSSRLTQLYQDQVVGDIAETWMMGHHQWVLSEFVGLLKVYRPVRYIQTLPDLQKDTLILPYPTYLSRGISITHNRSLLRNLSVSPETLLQTVAMIYQRRLSQTCPTINEDQGHPENPDIMMDDIRKVGLKELRLVCQGVQAIYGYKLTAKALLKLIS
jgi:hypothetical protein